MAILVDVCVVIKAPLYNEHTGELEDFEAIDLDCWTVECDTYGELIDTLNDCFTRSSSGEPDEWTWAVGYDNEYGRDAFEKGYEKETTVHFKRGQHPRYLKYWKRALLAATY